jgi:hypothetical protein
LTSSTSVVTALFGGTTNIWTSGDGFIAIPQPRKQLVFTQPFSGTGTLTFEYVQRPSPVYSSYRSYRIDSYYASAVVKYAAWLYKYRDREPNFGDAFYKIWDMQLRKMKAAEGKGTKRPSWKVNFNKRSWGDRSMR